MRRAIDESATLSGLQWAECRSHEIWKTTNNKGLIHEQHGAIWDVTKAAIAVRARSDEHQMALTEMDIGWIRLASLCREVQGATPMKLSVAQREQIYLRLSRAFSEESRAEMIGRVSLDRFGRTSKTAGKRLRTNNNRRGLKLHRYRRR